MLARRTVVLITLSCLLAGTSTLASGQGAASAATERKVTQRIDPSTPELAKKMHITGVVKLEAVVRPNGTVKSTRVIGGNPVLVIAASDAVSKWKFEAGPSETTELIQLKFMPD
jgi:TonB family protein